MITHFLCDPKFSLTGLWHLSTENSKLSLTSQWQFSAITHSLYEPKLSLTGQWQFLMACFKIVIDWSMTIFCDYPFPIQVTFPIQAQIVIDQSRTFFNRVFKNCHWPVKDNFLRLAIPYTSQNCHWPVNDNFLWLPIPYASKNCHWPVNDVFKRLLQNCHWPVNDNFLWLPNCYAKLSLTSQWHF